MAPPPGHNLQTCRCTACTAARKRAAEANTGGIGEGQPLIVPATTKLGMKQRSGGLTPQSKKILVEWIALETLHPEMTRREQAERLGVNIYTLRHILTKAGKEGLVKFDDPLDKLTHQLVPKVVENLEHFLDQKDKTVTIETAKATVFKQFQEAEGIKEQQTVIALKLDIVPAQGQLPEANIVGVGKIIDHAD